MILLAKLILAHLLGDFFLQPGSWVKEKEAKKVRSWKLYFHAALHGLLALAFVWQLSFWPYALFIAVTHGAIDAAKLTFQRKTYKWIWFVSDQVLHLLVIVGVWYYWLHPAISVSFWHQENTWWLITAILLLTLPASVGIKIFISAWAPDTGAKDGESLQHAGMYIGILERLFVFAFILSGHLEAVGFLLAAKSVFRFGDLKESKDRKLTEYVLIGTLLSFGVALLTGALLRYLVMQ